MPDSFPGRPRLQYIREKSTGHDIVAGRSCLWVVVGLIPSSPRRSPKGRKREAPKIEKEVSNEIQEGGEESWQASNQKGRQEGAKKASAQDRAQSIA